MSIFSSDSHAESILISEFPYGARRKGGVTVFRELAKAVALILTIISIYALLVNVFFVPGSPWQQRLLTSVETLAMTGCVCFASGLLFSITTPSVAGQEEPPVTRTLARSALLLVAGRRGADVSAVAVSGGLLHSDDLEEPAVLIQLRG